MCFLLSDKDVDIMTNLQLEPDNCICKKVYI